MTVNAFVVLWLTVCTVAGSIVPFAQADGVMVWVTVTVTSIQALQLSPSFDSVIALTQEASLSVQTCTE